MPIDVEVLCAEIGRLTGDRLQEVSTDMPPHTKDGSNFIDFGELLTRVENDRELLVDLISVFKVELPKQLAALRQAVESADAQRVAVLAHTLKGMLSNLAAHQAAAEASRLEQLARAGEVSALPGVFSSFATDATALLREVDSSLAEVRG